MLSLLSRVNIKDSVNLFRFGILFWVFLLITFQANIYAADGLGTMTISPTSVPAGTSGQTLTFVYTAAGAMTNGALWINVPTGGWSGTLSAVTTGTISSSSAPFLITGITIAAGSTVTLTFTNVTSGTTSGTNTFATRQKSLNTGTLTSIASPPQITVLSGDGKGTMTVTPKFFSANVTGETLTFTYTATTGGMSNGDIEITLPADGWNGTLSSVSSGTIASSSSPFHVSGVTLSAGSTLTLSVTNISVTSNTGAHTFVTKTRSSASGTLTSIAASPVVTVMAADGSGTMTVSPATIPAGETGHTLTFLFTVPDGGMNFGALWINLPTGGWNGTLSSASSGTISSSSAPFLVTGITLAGGSTITLTLTDVTTGTTSGINTFTTKQKSTNIGTLTSIASPPQINVLSGDGKGTMTVTPKFFSANVTGESLTFIYTATTGGMSNGDIEISLPADGWDGTLSSVSSGTIASSASPFHVSGVTLSAGNTLTLSVTNISVTSNTGAHTFVTKTRSSASGTLTSIAASPVVTVMAADGSGTMTVSPTSIPADETGHTLTFLFTVPDGGMNFGALWFNFPTGGWNGTLSSVTAGTISSSSAPFLVTGITLAGGSTITLTLTDVTTGTTGGANTFTTKQKSTNIGILTSIASPPQINVLSGDGKGTMTVTPKFFSANVTGETLTFTYTAASGGMSNGDIEISLPADGWDGTLSSISSGTIASSASPFHVSGVTLSAGSTLTLSVTNISVTSNTGAHTFVTKTRSSASGTLTSIAASPVVTVMAADGSGTMTVSPASVPAGETGQTLTFLFTVPDGGMNFGALWINLPTGGWNGTLSSASSGTISSSSAPFLVTGITLAGGSTITLTLTDVTSGTTSGINTFTTKQKTLNTGTLTNIAASPEIEVQPLNISIVSGNSQSNYISTSLPLSLTVVVTTHDGNQFEGMDVNFSITSAPLNATGASFSNILSPTNPNGQASADFTLGSEPGTYTITAAIKGNSVSFTATALPIASSGSYSITVPKGGEKWAAGSYKNIELKKFNGVVQGAFRLEYSTNNGMSWIKINNAPLAGIMKYCWLVPNVNSDLCKIKISNYYVNQVYYITQIPFSIYTANSCAQNYPNPFNPTTKIKFSLEKETFTTLRIYNCVGQQVAELVHNYLEAGMHEFEFNASKLSSGVYFYNLQRGKDMETHKIILAK